MSKVFSIISLLILTYLFATLTVNTAYALDTCNSIIITPPPPLIPPIYTDTPKTTFTLDVGGTTGYKGWKIGFPGCHSVIPLDASVDSGGRTISKEAENSNFFIGYNTDTNCTFSAGLHKLIATAVRNDISSSEVNICEASYKVEDANAQCTLTITPDKGITPASTIFVSGTGLVPRARANVFFGYGLFMDNKSIGRNVDTRNSSTLSGFQIPPSNLTPGPHQIDLRYPTIAGMLDPYRLPGLDHYGSPLCHINFDVGTPDKPGGVISTSTGGTTSGCTGSGCTFAGGASCDDDKNNPGIKTAIGCVHTNPISLIKDLLKFLTAIGGGLAFLMMLLGAFQMITSAGNPETLQGGRDRFQSAIIGLLFVIFAVLLLQIIGFDILKIPGFGR